MDVLEQLKAVSRRLEQMDQAGEWIARETVHSDNPVSQSGSLICALAADIQDKLDQVSREIEELITNLNQTSFH